MTTPTTETKTWRVVVLSALLVTATVVTVAMPAKQVEKFPERGDTLVGGKVTFVGPISEVKKQNRVAKVQEIRIQAKGKPAWKIMVCHEKCGTITTVNSNDIRIGEHLRVQGVKTDTGSVRAHWIDNLGVVTRKGTIIGIRSEVTQPNNRVIQKLIFNEELGDGRSRVLKSVVICKANCEPGLISTKFSAQDIALNKQVQIKGKLSRNNRFFAYEILQAQVANNPVNTPTPEATSTPPISTNPTSTPTSAPTVEATATSTPRPSQTTSPTVSPSSSPSSSPSASPSASPTHTVTSSPSASPSASPTPTPSPDTVPVMTLTAPQTGTVFAPATICLTATGSADIINATFTVNGQSYSAVKVAGGWKSTCLENKGPGSYYVTVSGVDAQGRASLIQGATVTVVAGATPSPSSTASGH